MKLPIETPLICGRFARSEKCVIGDCWNKWPMAAGRWPLATSFAGRSLARGGHDGGKLVGRCQQRGKLLFRPHARLDQQFEPEGGFIGFLFDRADFGNELRLASRPATGAIIGRHRGSTANNLRRNCPSGRCFWDRVGQLDDSECKLFGSQFEFRRIHAIKRQTPKTISNALPLGWLARTPRVVESAIGNRQSAIGNQK